MNLYQWSIAIIYCISLVILISNYLSSPISPIIYHGNMKYSDYFDKFHRQHNARLVFGVILAIAATIAIPFTA